MGSAFTHALAFALQGFVLLALLDASSAFVPVAFALAGTALAYLWFRWSAIPHWVDMCFGMLTLGNLGMLLGWWADNGFTALHDADCCKCVEAMRGGVMQPWMWAGMFAFANCAMLWFGRRPVPRGGHSLAMFTGGNAGMVAGMIAGGWVAARFTTSAMTLAVAASFAGMTVGMLAGMLLGTWLAERLFAGLRAIGFVPKWLKLNSSRSA